MTRQLYARRQIEKQAKTGEVCIDCCRPDDVTCRSEALLRVNRLSLCIHVYIWRLSRCWRVGGSTCMCVVFLCVCYAKSEYVGCMFAILRARDSREIATVWITHRA